MSTEHNWAIAERWTPELVADGFTPISDFFLQNYSKLKPPVSNSEAMFLIHLVSFKWDRDNPFPSLGTIAARMGVSASSVRLHARRLEEKKYLERISRPGETNSFYLQPLFDQLKKLLIVQETNKRRKRSSSIKHTETVSEQEKRSLASLGMLIEERDEQWVAISAIAQKSETGLIHTKTLIRKLTQKGLIEIDEAEGYSCSLTEKGEEFFTTHIAPFE